jgi:small subunit ribosomal protein S3Ae
MAVKSAGLKIKAKNWFKIFAPKSFGNDVIGESLVSSAENLIGKHLSISLSVLTGDMKKQGTILKFKVINTRPEGGNTEITGYEILSASLRRFMRRGMTDIANSFECMTADNIKVRIKPVAYVSNRAKSGISTLISKTIKFTLIKTVKSLKYNDLFGDVIAGKLQREMKEKLNKIYPVRFFEIKALLKAKGEGEIPEEDIETPEEKKENVAEAAEEPELKAEEVNPKAAVEKPEEIKAE